MRHNLWLLSAAFTMSATLALGTTEAEAKKPPKSAPVAVDAYKINTAQCHFSPPSTQTGWGWKDAHLTAQFIKSDADQYRIDILPNAKNIDEKLPIASIAKLMTALVIFDLMDQKKLYPHQMIAVTRESLCLDDNKFAVAGLPAGITEISVANALTQTLKKSSNTMAVNLAIAGAGSVDKFVDLMNAKARSWGMTKTNYLRPDGLPQKGDRKGEYTTASDMLIMAEHILPQFDRFQSYSNAPMKPWTIAEKPSAHPEKQMLTGLGAIFKTGTISECQSLVTMVERGDQKIVDIQLCGKDRFKNAIMSVNNGLKSLIGIGAKQAIASPAHVMNAGFEPVSSLPTLSSEP